MIASRVAAAAEDRGIGVLKQSGGVFRNRRHVRTNQEQSSTVSWWDEVGWQHHGHVKRRNQGGVVGRRVETVLSAGQDDRRIIPYVHTGGYVSSARCAQVCAGSPVTVRPGPLHSRDVKRFRSVSSCICVTSRKKQPGTCFFLCSFESPSLLHCFLLPLRHQEVAVDNLFPVPRIRAALVHELPHLGNRFARAIDVSKAREALQLVKRV